MPTCGSASALRDPARRIGVDGDRAAREALAAALGDAVEVAPLAGAGERDLDAAIERVTAAGLLVVDAAALGPAGSPDGSGDLTAREREVLALLARGLSNKRIGDRLSISEHTVKFHVGSVLAKLGAATRAEAVTRGVRRGDLVL